MYLHLKGLELWDMIEVENTPRKKDRQVMSMTFSTILDAITCELDVKKTVMET